MSEKKLILVDGSYYLFRAYHALPAFTNKKGEPTGAIYGVINMIRKLRAQYQPDYFAIIFDAPGKTFRSALYPEYKAHRPKPPDDLLAQIGPLHELIRALGIPLLCINAVEADDVIATLAVQAAADKIKTVIASGDKDLAQLVNDHITLFNPLRDLTLDIDGVIAKFGVPPERMIDYLSLVGDTVDNVPGVPNVGPKTAVKWLEEYGFLDRLMQHAADIKGRVGACLRANLEQLALSRELITLKTDVALAFSPEQLQLATPDVATLRGLYLRWDFKRWLFELDEQDHTQQHRKEADHQQKKQYKTLLDEAALDRWIQRLQQAELISLDTETTGLDYIQAKLVGISFAIKPNEAAYLPLAHDYPGVPIQLDMETTLKKLAPLLEDPRRPKIGQNLKYDQHIFANYGIKLAGVVHDTMLESYVINSTATRHNMDALARTYLNYETVHYEDVVGSGVKQIPFHQVDIETATAYAAEDADVVLALHNVLHPKICQLPALAQLYRTIEIPLLPVLTKMERHGVVIDAAMLREQSQALAGQMNQVEHEIYALAGDTFNINSPKQIQMILYDKMQLPALEKTPKGQPSTAESALQALAKHHELPHLILQHRGLSKLRSTYTERLPVQINPATGRIHTSYHQAVAVTGRLSSTAPNLQNIPIRNAAGRQIRQAFTCPAGYLLLTADYSQIELRIMAHLSEDPILLTAFANNEDIHCKTAAEVFSVAIEEVSDAQRRAAKAINFGLIYGMSAFGLARQLDIERHQAQQYIDRYFVRYPGVKNYMDTIRATAKEQGYVETVFHRRLYLPDINAGNAARRRYAERTAVNAPMQGTAADIIKRAMIAIDDYLTAAHDIDAHLVMQVHDELVFEVAEQHIERASRLFSKMMCDAASLRAPLEVDIGYGRNWDAAH